MQPCPRAHALMTLHYKPGYKCVARMFPDHARFRVGVREPLTRERACPMLWNKIEKWQAVKEK